MFVTFCLWLFYMFYWLGLRSNEINFYQGSVRMVKLIHFVKVGYSLLWTCGLMNSWVSEEQGVMCMVFGCSFDYDNYVILLLSCFMIRRFGFWNRTSRNCSTFIFVLYVYQSQEEFEAPMWADLSLESTLSTEDKWVSCDLNVTFACVCTPWYL